MIKQDAIRAIFSIWQENNPHPTTELIYTNEFELLIAVILSAQATDISVNKATRLLYAAANTPQTIYQLGESGLIEYIKTIGLYNAKAKNIIATCKILIDRYNSQVPLTMVELVELPGVGRKTANVVLNTYLKQPLIAVDTHVFRVANRIGLSNKDTVLGVELQLVKKIPSEFLVDAHHWLILHGRYVCKARTPDCVNCNISAYCQFYKKLNK